MSVILIVTSFVFGAWLYQPIWFDDTPYYYQSTHETLEDCESNCINGGLELSNDIFQYPAKYNLNNCYPNPFNPITTLRYDLPKDALVNITIYDMMGRQVSTLVSSQQTAGYKSVQWNATNDKGAPVSAGLYLYTIQAGKFRQTKKMVLLK